MDAADLESNFSEDSSYVEVKDFMFLFAFVSGSALTCFLFRLESVTVMYVATPLPLQLAEPRLRLLFSRRRQLETRVGESDTKCCRSMPTTAIKFWSTHTYSTGAPSVFQHVIICSRPAVFRFLRHDFLVSIVQASRQSYSK